MAGTVGIMSFHVEFIGTSISAWGSHAEGGSHEDSVEMRPARQAWGVWCVLVSGSWPQQVLPLHGFLGKSHPTPTASLLTGELLSRC